LSAGQLWLAFVISAERFVDVAIEVQVELAVIHGPPIDRVDVEQPIRLADAP